jgi:hypothetical protein
MTPSLNSATAAPSSDHRPVLQHAMLGRMGDRRDDPMNDHDQEHDHDHDQEQEQEQEPDTAAAGGRPQGRP